MVRLAGDFFLKSARIISTAIDTDLVTGMIFLAIVRANVRHLLEEPGRRWTTLNPVTRPPRLSAGP